MRASRRVMRCPPKLAASRWLLLASTLLASPASATIIDTGDVVLTANDLVIGNTADGSRTVDAEADGPYDSVSLGVAAGTTGELTLENAASFATTGALTLGEAGVGVVNVLGASSLTSAELRIFSNGVPAIHVDGAASTWTNDGLLQVVGRDSLDLYVSNGATLTTEGFLTDIFGFGRSITIEGAGSTWQNGGSFVLEGVSSFSVLDGASATDGDVQLGAFPGNSSTWALVSGSGSQWTTGFFSMSSFPLTPGGLTITGGGRVDSSGASLRTTYSQNVRIDGAGSTWSIDGRLDFPGSGVGGLNVIEVTNGGLLESGGASSGGGLGYANAYVDGTGSRWDVRGNLDLGGDTWTRLAISDGGEVTVHGDTVLWLPEQLSAPRSSIEALGPGSLLHADGLLILRNDSPGVPFGELLLLVADGGRAEAEAGITAFDFGEIELQGGTAATPVVALQGGSLVGQGIVDGDVVNDGRVAPGVGAGPLEVYGFLYQGSEGALEVELGGLAPGLEHSQLGVLGTAILGGALDVTFSPDYAPSLGDAYEILRAAYRVGEFESFGGLDLGNGRWLVAGYESDGVWLRVVTECANGLDDDGDGRIDYVPAGPGDPGCHDALSFTESPQCQDGLNNDNATGIDFDGGAAANHGVPLDEKDPQCANAWQNSERLRCGLGFEVVFLAPLLAQLTRRRRV